MMRDRTSNVERICDGCSGGWFVGVWSFRLTFDATESRKLEMHEWLFRLPYLPSFAPASPPFNFLHFTKEFAWLQPVSNLFVYVSNYRGGLWSRMFQRPLLKTDGPTAFDQSLGFWPPAPSMFAFELWTHYFGTLFWNSSNTGVDCYLAKYSRSLA